MVFYHVHAMNNWRDILLDQCTKMIYSGLYEAATAVYSGISGPSQEVQLQQCCLRPHALLLREPQSEGQLSMSDRDVRRALYTVRCRFNLASNIAVHVNRSIGKLQNTMLQQDAGSAGRNAAA